MAALDFPNAPTDGQIFSAANGVTYRWNAAKSLWLAVAAGSVVAAPTFDSINSLITENGNNGTISDVAMQITQGQQLFSRSFTANDAARPIEVQLDGLVGGNSSVAGWAVFGLFIDGAVAAVAQTVITLNVAWAFPFRLYWQGVLAAGAHTFAIRYATVTSGNHLNGNSGARIGGGAVKTNFRINEVGQGPVGPQGPSGPAGTVANPTYDEDTGYRTITTPYFALGDTVPVVTNGTRVFLRNFTAADAAHRIRVRAGGMLTAAAADHPLTALFIDNVCRSSRRITPAGAGYYCTPEL